MLITNKRTLEIRVVDMHERRLRHRRRRVIAWARAIDEGLDKNKIKMELVTLTYRQGEEWEALDIRDFCTRVRVKFGEKLLAYAWVGELHKSGKVHYHVLVVVEKGTYVPYMDDEGMWRKGSTRTEIARAPWYLVSYMKKRGGEKGYQSRDEFPRYMHIHSVWIREGVIKKNLVWRYRLSVLPWWLEKIMREGEGILEGVMPKRERGGWWIGNRCYGWYEFSDWRIFP